MERAKEKVNIRSKSIDAQVLKNMIMDHLSKDTNNIACDCPKQCQSGEEHVSYLKGKGISADDMVIKYTTTLFQIKINLVKENGDSQSFSWDPAPTDIENYMFYFPNLHYQSLQIEE